jgi:hypothetical protein
MANQSFPVLNWRLQPRPDWTDGELYIGGIGLALGYWRNPEETEFRFVIHPETGVRLYRTGDLGRAMPDGSIELLGRVDFQVKIQGRRIELGEIEHALKRHAMVCEAIVEAREDATGEKRLVAFIVPRAEAGADLTAMVLSHVAHELPRHMVPACCMVIDALPLSPNGKLDRKRLPEPDWHRDAGTGGQTHKPDAPETALEAVLLNAVSEVLGLASVGLHDNAFDLGANSVHMVQINRRLRDALNRRLPVAEMFNHATLASYARYLASVTDAAQATDAATRGGFRRAAMARRQAQAATVR